MSIFSEVPLCRDPFELLKRCQGYYECPKDAKGHRLGPLVGHAGTYVDGDEEKNYVGDVYYNFAMTETYPHVLDYYARSLADIVKKSGIESDVVLGVPMGGILLAGALARILENRVIFAEKRSLNSKGSGRDIGLTKVDGREKSTMILDRHRVREGDRVILVEDVCNNFSTPDKICPLVTREGGRVVAIACELNRSPYTEYESVLAGRLPTLGLLHIPTAQYRQDDPSVLHDIQISNVLWKPKDEWNLLTSYVGT